MQVIIPTDGAYNKSIREFVRYAGMHARAANKAAEIEMKLRAGVDIRSMTTDHGESRIKNCIKYDLGNGFRLVSVQHGELAILLYMGDHSGAERRLDRNRGLEPVINEKNWRVEFTIPTAITPWHVMQTASDAVTPTNVPFLQRVTGVNWDATIPSKATRSFLLKFNEDDEDQDLLEILEELRATNPKEAELCLNVINHLKQGQQDAAQR
jgi:hypothetical protein